MKDRENKRPAPQGEPEEAKSPAPREMTPDAKTKMPTAPKNKKVPAAPRTAGRSRAAQAWAGLKKRTKVALVLLLAALLALLLCFAVVLPLVRHFSGGGETTPVELLEGEDYYRYQGRVNPSVAVMYPTLTYGDIFQVVVHGDTEEYLFYHYQKGGKDYFLLGSYADADYDRGGVPSFYQPSAALAYSAFDYTSLYDGQGRIPAMLSAVGSVTFSDRVYLFDDTVAKEESERELHRFGLAEEDNAPWFEVTPYLTDRNGNYIRVMADGSDTALYYYDPAGDCFYHVSGVDYDEATGYTYDPAFRYAGAADDLVPTADPDPSHIRRVRVGRALSDNSGYYLMLEGRGVVYAVKTVRSQYADIDYSLLVHRTLAYYVRPRLLTEAASAYDPLYTPDLTIRSGRVRATGETPQEGDLVQFSYRDGDGRKTGMLLLDDVTNSMAERFLLAVVGQTGMTLRDDGGTPEDLSDDVFYEDVTLEGAVAYTADLSFGYYAFVGNGKKDSFLGESIYTVKAPSELSAYGVDYSASVGVLQILSGLAGVSQAQQASTGIDWNAAETVAVGPGGRLTAELLEKYDLLSHRISYTLPYNVTTDSAGNPTYKVSLDFELFVGDEKGGYRYAACSLFGTVVKLDADIFSFLDWEILGRWSRGNLLMVAASDLRAVSYETFYSDRKVTHTFFLSEDDSYVSAVGADPVSRLYVAYAAQRLKTKSYTDSDGVIRPGFGRAVTKSGTLSTVTEFVSAGAVSLDSLYEKNGYDARDGVDGMGVYFFRHLLTALYSTYYSGEASSDLDDAALSALLSDDDHRLSRLSVVLTDGRVFVYDFYAYSARRAVVRLRAYPTQAASEAGMPGSCTRDSAVFTLNTSEIGKLTSLFDALSGGVPFDEDDFY